MALGRDRRVSGFLHSGSEGPLLARGWTQGREARPRSSLPQVICSLGIPVILLNPSPTPGKALGCGTKEEPTSSRAGCSIAQRGQAPRSTSGARLSKTFWCGRRVRNRAGAGGWLDRVSCPSVQGGDTDRPRRGCGGGEGRNRQAMLAPAPERGAQADSLCLSPGRTSIWGLLVTCKAPGKVRAVARISGLDVRSCRAGCSTTPGVGL